ncbi:MAG: cysteine desulfurase [Candidatus Lokiarchaeota archaeon]|nr:cysteine desulfurase [Candidatus Lokiarchaeota archaeon]
MNIKEIRKDFPILRKKKIIYLDNAATSLTPNLVIDKMIEYYKEYRSNIGRGIYELSQLATTEYEKAKATIQNFIRAKSSSEIITTKNATEGINIIANGLKWKKEDNIISTVLEHHSNYLPWIRIRNKYKVGLEIIYPDYNGKFNINDFEDKINENTKIVSITHLSNVIGNLVPIDKIVKIAHDYGAMVLIDGAQSVPHLGINVNKIDCDFLVFSGHKMCGPTGIGILYIKKELQEKIEPLNIGGGSIKRVEKDNFEFLLNSNKFEAGTPPIAQLIGLGEAIKYLQSIGLENIANHDISLIHKVYDCLSQIKDIEIYGGNLKNRIGIISFNIKGVIPHDLALSLDISSNICIRSGFLCAEPLIKNIFKAPNGVIRLSTYLYNNEREIDVFLENILKIAG